MTASSGVPPARAHVRHRVNMGNKDFEIANILAPIAQRRGGGLKFCMGHGHGAGKFISKFHSDQGKGAPSAALISVPVTR